MQIYSLLFYFEFIKQEGCGPSWSPQTRFIFVCFLCCFFPFYDTQMSRSSHLFSQQVAFIEEVVTRNWSISNCWHLDQKWARSSFVAPVPCRHPYLGPLLPQRHRTTFTVVPTTQTVATSTTAVLSFNQWLRENTTVTTNILLGFLILH